VILGARRTDYTNVSTTSVYHVDSTTPQYALIYNPWTHTSFYASYIEGLEEGGTAPLSTVNGGQVLSPGKSKQKEVGVRSEAIRGLQVSLAYFNIERASAYTNTANVFVLDGRTEYKGWEYSASGEFTKELSVYVSGLFLDAKQKSAQNAALIGRWPDNTPNQSHSFFIEYRPSFIPNLGVNGGAYYTGKRFINNFEQGSIPGYTIYTAGAHYRMRVARSNVTFTLFTENAGDKRYWSAAGGGFLAVGLPRTTKFSMKMDF
jgi:iron complex outermembrane receptor protein